MPATVEEVDAHVVTLLRRAMKVRSAMRRETASPAVREEAERRKQAITGARNVLREGLRNAARSSEVPSPATPSARSPRAFSLFISVSAP